MRPVLTAVLVAILSIALVEAPVMAGPASAPSAPLGVVLSADNANVGASVTSSGATIYDGDRLQTPENGTLRVRLGGGQMVLRASTDTEVHSLPNGFFAKLNNGSVGVSSAEGQTFELLADGATIRPANSQPSSAQITMVTPKELVLTGARGTLLVSMGNEVRTIEAGSSYRLEVVESAEADAGPGPAGAGASQQPPRGAGRNRFLLFLIPAVGAVTGILIWRAVISNSAPK